MLPAPSKSVIETRTVHLGARVRFGHWEALLILFAGPKGEAENKLRADRYKDLGGSCLGQKEVVPVAHVPLRLVIVAARLGERAFQCAAVFTAWHHTRCGRMGALSCSASGAGRSSYR